MCVIAHGGVISDTFFIFLHGCDIGRLTTIGDVTTNALFDGGRAAAHCFCPPSALLHYCVFSGGWFVFARKSFDGIHLCVVLGQDQWLFLVVVCFGSPPLAVPAKSISVLSIRRAFDLFFGDMLCQVSVVDGCSSSFVIMIARGQTFQRFHCGERQLTFALYGKQYCW